MFRKKISDLLLIIFFIIIIILPNLFFNFRGKISRIENKTLALRPQFYSSEGKLNSNFIHEFETYYSDRIGMKEYLIGSFMILKDKIFHVLNIPDYMWGKNNEMYYSGGTWAIDMYNGKIHFSEEILKREQTNLTILSEYLDFMKIKNRIFVFIPSKEQIYFENYPSFVPKAKSDMVDELCDFLSKNSNLDILNAKQLLLSHKNNSKPLYYKCFDPTHWNSNGAFIVYQEAMKRLFKHDKNLKILSKDEIDIKEDEFRGLSERYSLINWLNKSFSYKDIIYSYIPKNKYEVIFDRNYANEIGLDRNIPYKHLYNTELKNKKTIFVYGDSYLENFWLDWLAQSFENVYFLHSAANIDILNNLIIETKPDYFILERVDRVYFSFENLKILKQFYDR